jgi:RNA polymerase sigma factor (sigma-70 family)
VTPVGMDALESDEALLAASRDGGREAFARLVARYQDLVCALTFSATGNKAMSEDLAQDTFLAAWRGLPELREPGRFRSWLCSIARNLGRNARRDGGRELPTEPIPEVADDTAVLDALSEREEEALVWRALSQMSESYREPLVLFYREGKSAADVAQALGLSVNATEQRLSRGRKQLKESVAAIVERTLERSRPGAGFLAAVIAAIGSETVLPTTASAATEAAATATKPTASMGAMIMAIAWKTMLVGAAASAITYGCITWNESGERGGTEDARRDGGVDEARVAAPGPQAAEDITELVSRRSRAAQSGAEGQPLPRYELTVPSHKLAAVKLAGGRSEVKTFAQSFGGAEDPEEPIVRTISGRVIGLDGQPLENVVVLGGEVLACFSGDSLTSQKGATTGGDGRFELAITHAERVVVVALHESGWSEMAFVAPGSADDTVELRIRPPARIEGTLRRDGEAAQPQVSLRDEAKGLSMMVEGTADGRFAIDAVPPGRYTISVGLVAGVPGIGAAESRASRTIDVVAGKTVEWDVSLDAGTTVVVTPRLPTGVDHQQITYAKIAGAKAPKSFTEVKALPKDEVDWLLFGGDDLDNVMEFRDVERGRTTFCVNLEDGDEQLGFGCRTVDVRASVEVQEIEVEVKPARGG